MYNLIKDEEQNTTSQRLIGVDMEDDGSLVAEVNAQQIDSHLRRLDGLASGRSICSQNNH